MKLKTTVPVLAVLIFGLATMALAAEPMAELKSNIDNFLTLLKDPQYSDPAKKEEQKDKIWRTIDVAFDLEGVARLALGKNWQSFSAQEQKDFSEAFADLLGGSYIDRIREGYGGEDVTYLGQESISETKAVVNTKIVRSSGEIPINYSMLLKNGHWRIYDVKIEGVSMVRNYRAQFDNILMNSKPADLIARVKSKVGIKDE